jgi:soluble lytic murein transglycosylase
MQIIPATGEDIARRLGWPENYALEDLGRPLVNLTFGSDYLAAQRDRFDGNLFAALAAYNGGPANAERWLQLAPDDPDLFLEVIRFAETRDYIRRVHELFSIYRWLYDRTP